MKKYIHYALIYAVAGLVSGVFYREFTKFNGFTGVTSLGKVHTHLLVLGMFLFLIVALFAQNHPLEEDKYFRIFLKIYHLGLVLSAVTMVARGITQVLAMTISKGLDASIAGLSGIGHILVSIGLICLLVGLKRVAKN